LVLVNLMKEIYREMRGKQIVVSMFDKNLPAPIFVAKPQALHRLVEKLAKKEILAVDTESNSLYAYRERVCLIQFSTTEEDYLVDPLALDDLSPLGPIFQDQRIEKVFHASEYDLLCMKRDFDFHFNNIFDTMVAASVLGRTEVGLASMLENEFGVEVNKRYQRADWGKRPLPQQFLNYARMDTHFLIHLRDRLTVELQMNDLLPLALEDFNRLAQIGERNIGVATENKEFVNESCWRISGSYELSAQQAAILLELCKYRDHVAKSSNRPLFKVISDATLLSIAQAEPRTMNQLTELPGMTQGQVYRHGEAILKTVEKGKKSPPIYYSRAPKPDEQYIARVEELRRWRKTTAQVMGVKSDIILPRDLMTTIAEKSPRNKEELSHILQDVPWRLEHFGTDILKVLQS